MTYLVQLQSSYSDELEDLAIKVHKMPGWKKLPVRKSISSCADGISILTDARHCWRKNAKFSDRAFLGQQTHKVLRIETVTKSGEKCSQKHEMVDVKRFCGILTSRQYQ